ncbi:MAG: ribonuclease P protein component [Candidatus Velthaea sp.]
MRAYDALRRRADFARVRQRGRRTAAAHLICLTTDARLRSRVGITVSAHVGCAVVRNRLRRRIKAILDRYNLNAPPHRDIVFIARPGAGQLAFTDLAAEVERTLGPPA